MRSIKKALRRQIDPAQREYMNGVEWLVNDGPRASGRTHLLALAFVKKAIRCGHPVYVWDHHEAHRHMGSIRGMFNEIHKVVDEVNRVHQYEILDVHVNRNAKTIQIVVKRDPASVSYKENTMSGMSHKEFIDAITVDKKMGKMI